LSYLTHSPAETSKRRASWVGSDREIEDKRLETGEDDEHIPGTEGGKVSKAKRG
jgi:hypothetical protein